MIPTLLEQVLAAHVPTAAEQVKTSRRQEGLEKVEAAVRSIGNASAKQIQEATGMHDRTVREALGELEKAGVLYSFKSAANRNTPRRWNIK